MVFILGCRRRHLLQVFFIKNSCTATFHLFKVITTANISHEDKALNRLYVCTRCNHIYRNSYTRIVIISECRKHRLRFISLTCNFLAEFISFSKFVSNNLYYIICVTIRFRKNKCLWNLSTVRE